MGDGITDRERIDLLCYELRRAAHKLEEASGYIGTTDKEYAESFRLAATFAREAIANYRPKVSA